MIQWFLTLKIDLKSQIFGLLTPPYQLLKINNFLWFVGKNLSYFVTPARKINNPYYHNYSQRYWAVQVQQLWLWNCRGKEIKETHRICSWKNQAIQVQHLWIWNCNKFWFQETHIFCSWRNQAIQVRYLWL